MVCFYSDETGQQSRGRFFVVAGLSVDANRAQVTRTLHDLEEATGKRQADWAGCDHRRRQEYLARALGIPEIHGRVFFQVYERFAPRQYFDATVECLVQASERFAPKMARAIHHEGITRTQRERMRKALRATGGAYEVRSGKFRSRPEVRLADTLANVVARVRFGEAGHDYSHLMPPWFVDLRTVQEKAPATPSGIRGRA